MSYPVYLANSYQLDNYHLLHTRFRSVQQLNYQARFKKVSFRPVDKQESLIYSTYFKSQQTRPNQINLKLQPKWKFWLRFISVRRSFYGQLVMSDQRRHINSRARLIYERSAGQFHKQRQRLWAWKLLMRHFLERLTKIPLKVKLPPKPKYIRYKISYIRMLRQRKLRLPWWEPYRQQPYLYLQRRRPRLMFSFERYQPTSRWYALQRELRLWLRKYRNFYFKIKIFYTQPRPHNGQRLKKVRRH